MTLLESTSLLVTVVKENGLDENKLVRRAVKRMEQRLEVLKLRAAKALRSRRQSAWRDWECVYTDNCKASACHDCGVEISFGDFVRHAELTGNGHIRRFKCPACDVLLIGYPEPGDIVTTKGKRICGKPMPPTQLLAEEIEEAQLDGVRATEGEWLPGR